MLREIAMSTVAEVIRAGEVVPATAIYRLPNGNVWSEFKEAHELRDLLCSVVTDMNRLGDREVFPEEYVVFAQLGPDLIVLLHEDQDTGAQFNGSIAGGKVAWEERPMERTESLFCRPPRRMQT